MTSIKDNPASTTPPRETRVAVLICVGLVIATAAAYWPLRRSEFIRLDDNLYVTENRQVQAGLTARGLAWAFKTDHAANWHPLTWLSHMLDCEIYGLNPAGHHATSFVLHVLNALLLFGLLRSMTRALWPSAFVAALFALHPLRVESVAWVAERKDVLSMFFALLATWAYAAYTKRGGIGRYLLAALLLALGLMAKPMLVTLPLVFLLLDYWPLERFRTGRPSAAVQKSLSYLLAEKVPLLALSAASCVVTYIVQRESGAIDSSNPVAIHLRVANAVVSYARYIGMMFWPSDLAILYPHPDLPGGTPLGPWPIVGACVLLVSLTVLIVMQSGRRPYAIVGWLWYLGTLVPVIGLVQVGFHAIADRYTYVPLIGLFIMIAWGVDDAVQHWTRHRAVFRTAVASAAAGVLTAYMVCTWGQVRHWRDSVTLFEHTLAVTSENPIIRNNLGNALSKRGRIEQAVEHYKRALQFKPDYAEAHNNLGSMLALRGKLEEAIEHFRRALRIRPDLVNASHNLGRALAALGRTEEAIEQYRQALAVDPRRADAHADLGNALRSQDKIDEAIEQYRQALTLDPDQLSARNNLGNALMLQGKLEEATEHFRRALQIRPDLPHIHQNLGLALKEQGKDEEAATHFQRGWELLADRASNQR